MKLKKKSAQIYIERENGVIIILLYILQLFFIFNVSYICAKHKLCRHKYNCIQELTIMYRSVYRELLFQSDAESYRSVRCHIHDSRRSRARTYTGFKSSWTKGRKRERREGRRGEEARTQRCNTRNTGTTARRAALRVQRGTVMIKRLINFRLAA